MLRFGRRRCLRESEVFSGRKIVECECAVGSNVGNKETQNVFCFVRFSWNRDKQPSGWQARCLRRLRSRPRIDAAPSASVIVRFDSCSPDFTVVQFAAASILLRLRPLRSFIVIDCRYQ